MSDKITCVGEMMVLLHHHCSGAPYPDPCAIYGEWVERLCKLGLLERDDKGLLRSTEKGEAFIESVLGVPLPKLRWVSVA